MVYNITLYGSLAIFAVGLLYRISHWFRYKIEPDAAYLKTSHRIGAAARGIVSTLFSTQILVLLRIFILDVIFQKYLMKAGLLRWFGHLCIYGGFMLLLFTHALEKFIMAPVFDTYYSTLNPFMFLRNCFGALVILGLFIVMARRYFSALPRPQSTAVDHYAIFMLAFIMISGFFLEATKIISHNAFTEMANDYASLTEENDAEALNDLNAYWVENFGVVSPNVKGPFDEETLLAGKEISEESCMQCHSRPQSAFISYGLSRILTPIALSLDRADMRTLLWYLHFLVCFAGLAYLPFSKFFHIFSTPIHLFVKELIIKGKSEPANLATMYAISLDACTHCGDCTQRCSVAVASNEIPNPNILPSEKHAAFRSLLSGRNLSKRKLVRIQEGSFICTDCHRCTDICPVGIDLEVLWRSLKQHVADLGYPKPEAWARDTIGEDFVIRRFGDETLSPPLEDTTFIKEVSAATGTSTFSLCFGCQNCTNVCPVVAAHESPRKRLGLLPHEIMHCLALKQKDFVLGSMMLWDCLTCYLCQEQCPQGVCITDVLYQLKNMALNQLKQEA